MEKLIIEKETAHICKCSAKKWSKRKDNVPFIQQPKIQLPLLKKNTQFTIMHQKILCNKNMKCMKKTSLLYLKEAYIKDALKYMYTILISWWKLNWGNLFARHEMRSTMYVSWHIRCWMFSEWLAIKECLYSSPRTDENTYGTFYVMLVGFEMYVQWC